MQSELHEAQFARGVRFSIKIGIGVGFANVLYVGGMYGRSEYLTTGEALTQAFKCEAECGYGTGVRAVPAQFPHSPARPLPPLPTGLAKSLFPLLSGPWSGKSLKVSSSHLAACL